MPKPLCSRPPLQTSDIYCSAQVQEWLSPSGSGRSRPANIFDEPVTINNNTLRSTKGPGTSNSVHSGGNPAGGCNYSASALLDNWAETRECSSSYQAERGYRLRPASGTKSTEYQVAISAPATSRIQQLQQCYLGSNMRSCSGNGTLDSGGANSSMMMSSSAALHSSNSTGSSSSKSHAQTDNRKMSTSRQGNSPSSTWQHGGSSKNSPATPPSASIAATTLQHAKLEFQRPEAGNARAKILAIGSDRKAHDVMMADKYRERIIGSQRLTSSWASMYAQDYLKQPFVAPHEKPKDVCPDSEL